MALKKNTNKVKAKNGAKPVAKVKSGKAAAKKSPAKIKPVSKKTSSSQKSKAAPVVSKPAKAVVKKGGTKETKPLLKEAAVSKTKAVVTTPAPVWVYPDKNSPLTKVKTILISQPKPVENEKSPYLEIAKKYNVKINFRQFIQVQPVHAKEFRSQRINLTEHNAVILTSRVAIDHYFRMCNEMRYTVPETTKYFCLTESIAYYLQKYVQYRKRKIFYGQASINDLVDVIKKHREERFLLPVSDVHREKIVEFLDEMKLNYSKATFYRTVSADLSDMGGKLDYDVVLFFTPAGIESLFKNFPDYKQGSTRIGGFGAATCKAIHERKLRLDIAAPNPETPSMAMALENYVREVNKR